MADRGAAPTRAALSQALLVIGVALVAQAAVNAICICWAHRGAPERC